MTYILPALEGPSRREICYGLKLEARLDEVTGGLPSLDAGVLRRRKSLLCLSPAYSSLSFLARQDAILCRRVDEDQTCDSLLRAALKSPDVLEFYHLLGLLVILCM